MNFGKIFDILGDENIDKQEVFKLVDVIRNMDLDDEINLRSVIKQAAVVAHKKIDIATEDAIVKKIQQEGLTPSLFDFIK